jgi:hypothetical protein
MHPRHRMNLGALGQTGTREASRVSAVLVSKSGGGVSGIDVKLYDTVTGSLLETRATDRLGQVAFDLAYSNQIYLIRPSVPEGLLTSPLEKKVTSLPVGSWNMDKSAQFLVYQDLHEGLGTKLSLPPVWVLALIGVGIWVAWPLIGSVIDRIRNRD